MQAPPRGRWTRALPRLAAQAHRTGAAGRLPAEHDAVAGHEPVHALTDRLDRSGAFVPEQHREGVPPAVLLDHVQVAVTDARRLDPDEHLARSRLADLDLLESDLAGRDEDYAALSHERSSSRIECAPASARVRSISAIRFWSSSSTPRCPPTASAYA